MFNRFLWKYFVRRTARTHGFLDPIVLFSRLSRFAQPSEVLAPTELMRATAVLHARGLLNAQVIQHNLDWVWPYWVNQQFDPYGSSFIPRSFSLTHINLTHRNWTAVGRPDSDETPIVDPRGLVTPFWDGWSIDAWVTRKDGKDLIPSRLEVANQYLDLDTNAVVTNISLGDMSLLAKAEMVLEKGSPVCRLKVSAHGPKEGSLVISLRPYNPEGVSLVSTIARNQHKPGWLVNRTDNIYLDREAQRYVFSNYHNGDVYHRLYGEGSEKVVKCPVEMCSAAAMYPLGDGQKSDVTVQVPLKGKEEENGIRFGAARSWSDFLEKSCRISIPEKPFQYLYDASVRTVLILTANDVYAGPYTYKRFWFRDAVFISYALLCAGFHLRVCRIIDGFERRQKISGYFESQEGEWDSNGQVLWLIHKYCQMANVKPRPEWKNMIYKGARWIVKKRLPDHWNNAHAGLMPAGFSAEHFGPNDYYYWDNFWSIGGLEAAAALASMYEDKKSAEEFSQTASKLSAAVEKSLAAVEERMNGLAMPSSPYRRLDTSSVGSLVCGYPLQIDIHKKSRLLETCEYLVENCLVHNGLFHDMSHSGINPYLTLHIAQILLRSGDARYLTLMKSIADLASPTGQWPEAVHPTTKGGCMGDGQHTWAASEWIIMMRNCFLREEERDNKLILCSGIPKKWLTQADEISFGPAPTIYGLVSMTIRKEDDQVRVAWTAQWHRNEPQIEVQLPGAVSHHPSPGETEVLISIF